MSSRTHRLSLDLLNSDRMSAHWDPQSRTEYPFRKRALSLEKYADRNNVFVSFTNLPKLGINPSTDYNTPIGVYCYPIDYVIEKVKPQGHFGVPFAGGASYLHVFSVSGIENTLQFSRGDNDLVYIAKHPGISNDFKVTPEEKKEIDELLENTQVYIDMKVDELPSDPVDYYHPKRASYDRWYLTWKKNFMEYVGILKYNQDFIDEFMYYFSLDRLWIYTRDTYGEGKDGFRPSPYMRTELEHQLIGEKMVRGVIFPYEGRLRELREVQELGDEGYYRLKKKSLASDQRVACDEAFVWNFTRLLSGGNITRWTGMMRRMGFIGAVDYNTETIHPGEPTQAVFFNPPSIHVEEVIHNQTPSQYNQEYQYDYSVWAENPREAVDVVHRRILEEVESLQRRLIANPPGYTNYNLLNTLERLIKLVAWMNFNSKKLSGWFEKKKDTIRNTILKMHHEKLDDNVQRLMDKLLRSLERRN